MFFIRGVTFIFNILRKKNLKVEGYIFLEVKRSNDEYRHHFLSQNQPLFGDHFEGIIHLPPFSRSPEVKGRYGLSSRTVVATFKAFSFEWKRHKAYQKIIVTSLTADIASSSSRQINNETYPVTATGNHNPWKMFLTNEKKEKKKKEGITQGIGIAITVVYWVKRYRRFSNEGWSFSFLGQFIGNSIVHWQWSIT